MMGKHGGTARVESVPRQKAPLYPAFKYNPKIKYQIWKR